LENDVLDIVKKVNNEINAAKSFEELYKVVSFPDIVYKI
jgi:hypothetical protein